VLGFAISDISRDEIFSSSIAGQTNYEQLPALFAEIVRLNVDVIVTYGTPGVRAAKQATTTIPIVMATSGDAETPGLVASLARPGGNVTGLTFLIQYLLQNGLNWSRRSYPI
jgi:putative ABC transport system substrate-binding protein